MFEDLRASQPEGTLNSNSISNTNSSAKPGSNSVDGSNPYRPAETAEKASAAGPLYFGHLLSPSAAPPALLDDAVAGLPRCGVAAVIRKLEKAADGTLRVEYEGMRRFRLLTVSDHKGYLVGAAEWYDDESAAPGEALYRSVQICTYVSAFSVVDCWLLVIVVLSGARTVGNAGLCRPMRAAEPLSMPAGVSIKRKSFAGWLHCLAHFAQVSGGLQAAACCAVWQLPQQAMMARLPWSRLSLPHQRQRRRCWRPAPGTVMRHPGRVINTVIYLHHVTAALRLCI